MKRWLVTVLMIVLGGVMALATPVIAVDTALGADPASHTLSAPGELTWGIYYFEDENGEFRGFDLPGVISWKVTDTEYDHKIILKVYHEDNTQEPVYEKDWSYHAGSAVVWSDHGFSECFPGEGFPNGKYQFTLQAQGDGETTCDSDIVYSDSWSYVKPDVSYKAPSYPEWSFPMIRWDDFEFTYDEYCGGYSVEYWYSATEADAASTEALTRLGGYVWYFGEENYNTYHVIPQAYLISKGAGYYYFSVRSHSNDILAVSHSEQTLSKSCYFAGDLVTHTTEEGVLTIVDQAAASGTGWIWDGETLTLSDENGFGLKAIRFLPYVSRAVIALGSDIILDSSGIQAAPYQYQQAVDLEASEGVLEIRTGENALTIVSDGGGIYSAGSMIIADSIIDAQGKEEIILADRGDMTIQNSDIKAVGGKYSWGLYVHGYRIGEEDTCRKGHLIIENSAVYASTVDSAGEGFGNAIYSDGDMNITVSDIITNGGNNGIGNDCGGVMITDSTVHSKGDYLGIFSYHTIIIENSTVTAEGTRAIEIASRTEEPPKVEQFVLKKGEIVEPENGQVLLIGVTYPWSDTVVSVAYDADETAGEKWEPAALVKIIPAEDIKDRISDLLPKEDGERVEIAQVQESLADHTNEIKQALNEDLHGEGNSTVELVQKLEAATGIDSSVDAEKNTQFNGACVLGAALNAAAGAEKVELVIAPASTGISVPEEYNGLDCVTFSMTLTGAVDADNNTENGQQLIVPVQITLPIPEHVDPRFLVVLHFRPDTAEVETIEPQVSGGNVTFVADGFSDYALVNQASVKTNRDGVEVMLAGTDGKTAIAAVYGEQGQMIGVSWLINGKGKISCDLARAAQVRFFLMNEQCTPVAERKTLALE